MQQINLEGATDAGDVYLIYEVHYQTHLELLFLSMVTSISTLI